MPAGFDRVGAEYVIARGILLSKPGYMLIRNRNVGPFLGRGGRSGNTFAELLGNIAVVSGQT